MQEHDPSQSDISEAEWVHEIAELGTKFERRSLFVEVWWSFGHLRSIGFLPQVNARTIHVLLQQQSQTGLADGVISVSLPKPGQGQYRKQKSQSGEVVLTMFYPIGKPPDVLDWVEVQIGTDADFLSLVNSESRLQ